MTDALGQKTKFENNGNRDMKKLTDARNNSYNLAWENGGVRKSLQWPDASKQTNVFDANGRLSQWKAKGDAGTVNFSRNDAGEVTGRAWTTGTESGSASFSRNSLGQITNTSTTTMGLTVNQTLSYNAEGQLSGLSQSVSGVTRTAGVTYDSNGRIASITYPAGFVVAYEYNADGQVAAIKKDGTAIAGYAYDSSGRLSARTLSSGVVTSYTYDAANRLASITVSNGSNVLWAERYGYNAAGERIYTIRGTSGTAGDGYWLDATSQLRGVKYGSSDATATYSSQNGTAAEWQYDAVGNRVTETGGSGNTTYSSSNTNQYTAVSSVSSVAFSSRGDLVQFGDWTYSYDAQGNLIRAGNGTTSAQYWRDAFGNRAVKDANGSKTVFFNVVSTQLEVCDVTNVMASSTIYEPGIDHPLAEVSSSGALTFYHQDWLGNVVLLTSSAGAKVESYMYDVWGKASASDNSGLSVPLSALSSRFLYTAREYDRESGIYHYRARAYSPALGRFLQTDPIDFDGGDVNLFRYVGNNPVNYIDPDGKSATAFMVAGTILAAASIYAIVVAVDNLKKQQEKAYDELNKMSSDRNNSQCHADAAGEAFSGLRDPLLNLQNELGKQQAGTLMPPTGSDAADVIRDAAFSGATQ